MNVGVALANSARRHPGHVAVFERDRQLSFVQLNDRAARFANLLLEKFKVARGDRVAVLVRNRLELVELLAGTAMAGGVYVGLNFRLSRSEYDAIFENAEPRILVSEREYAEVAGALADQFEIPLVIVDDSGSTGYEELLSQSSPRYPSTLHEVRATDDFCIVYSSGTTGLPKGILFDHGAVLHHGLAALIEYDFTPETRYLLVIPHNSSVQIALIPSLMIGSTIGISESRQFDGERFVADVGRHTMSHSFLVPTQLSRLLEHVPAGVPLPTLETLGYGSAPIPPDHLRELVERYGPIFTQLYGMAEIASIGTMLRKADHADALQGQPKLLASCGKPSFAIDVRVVDDAGQDVARGDRGEVVFAGPYVMKEYFRDPIRTAEAVIGGWLHSGDVAETDNDGFLYIVDRKKDLIIRGGLNIAPKEIENVLYRHEGVLEVAVIGIPDETWGEAVVAVVALKDQARVSAEDLVRWCQGSDLQSIKVPQTFEFMDSLPKNALGKIAKRELRDRFWSGTRKV